jgi:EAL domain-containing protein (putative c-di-GMP-specific phosphodiesterase class I)
VTYVTLSIGIGLFPKDGKERETIVSNADMAMYEAKRNSKNNYKFFSKDLTQTSKERLKIVKGLKELISKKDFSNQFNMVYQPIFSNTQNNDFSIVGSEALLRWNHPLHGNIPPDLFIPIAEESNLIQHFGDWVFQQSLTDFKLLNALHPDASFYISINLSAKQLDAPQIVSDIEQAVQKALLLPKQIQIEITETGIIKDSNLAFKNLYQLAEMGFRLAIDDFGVGFASLSYLQKIPASVIKIDKTFIQQSLTSSKNRDLVKAIIMMGQNLKKEVIAEGVEEKKHLSFLMEHNCFTYQGYYFSKPLPFAEMKQLLNKKR